MMTQHAAPSLVVVGAFALLMSARVGMAQERPSGAPPPRGQGMRQQGGGGHPGMRPPMQQGSDGQGMRPGGPGGPGMGGPGGPGGPGERQPPPPPPDWQPPAALIAQVKASEPEFAAFLDRVKATDPDRWVGELWHVSQEARHVAMLRERDETDRAARVETTARLERKVRALVEGLGGKQPSDAQAASLRDALGQLFDQREEMRREEITQLEKRITDLKSGLSDRRAHKVDIVDRRLKELLAKDDTLGW